MYKSIADYVRKKMNGLCGDFEIVATDLSEKEPGCILATVHPIGRDGDTADFVLYPDGREEYTESN